MNEKTAIFVIDPISFNRDKDSHKGDYGRVLIAAGGFGMCGAAILAAKGACRSGSGVVSVAIPKEYFPVIHSGIWETVLVDRKVSIENIDDYHAIAIGPGMGKNNETKQFLDWVLNNYSGPLVLDADALNVLAESQDFSQIKDYKGPLIITPHYGEARRLLNIPLKEYNDLTRQEVLLGLVKTTQAIVVLKGSNTLVSSPGDEIRVNPNGNPGMATGGTGDILTGIITALLGRGFKAWDAAIDGVFIHGLAGDIAANTQGMTSMTAGDVIDSLPAAFMEFERRF